MKSKLALAVVSVVLIAGCTSTTTTQPTGESVGLAITDFTWNPSEARQDQTAVAKLVVENRGQRDVSADDYFVLLIGPIGTGAGEWQKISGNNPQTSTASMRRALGEQKAVPRTFTWSVKAPKSQGADTPVDFTARVYYNYQTEATGVVNVYPDSEVDRATETSEFSSSKGPLEIVVEVNPNPPLVYANGDEFTLTIHAKNKGNGIVFLNNSVSSTDYNIDSQTELGKVLLNITLPSGLTLSDSSCQENIQFFGTSKEEITTCAVKVDSKPATKTPYRISVRADYGYYDEAKARVVLKAR